MLFYAAEKEPSVRYFLTIAISPEEEGIKNYERLKTVLKVTVTLINVWWYGLKNFAIIQYNINVLSYFIKDKIYRTADPLKILEKYFMHIVWSFDCYFQIICSRLFQSTKLRFVKALEDN